MRRRTKRSAKVWRGAFRFSRSARISDAFWYRRRGSISRHFAANFLAALVRPSAHASKYLNNQPIVSVNRTGASGAIGTMAVKNAAPDGYTLLVARIATHAILPALEPRQSKEPADLQLRLVEGLVDRRLASAPALHKLASLYENCDRLDQARQTLEKVAALGGPTPELLLQLARVAHKQRDYQGALGYLAHARDLKPDDAGVHFFFGIVCVELPVSLFEAREREVA